MRKRTNLRKWLMFSYARTQIRNVSTPHFPYVGSAKTSKIKGLGSTIVTFVTIGGRTGRPAN